MLLHRFSISLFLSIIVSQIKSYEIKSRTFNPSKSHDNHHTRSNKNNHSNNKKGSRIFKKNEAFKVPDVKNIDNLDLTKEKKASDVQVDANFLKQKYKELGTCNGNNILEINILGFQKLVKDGKLTYEQMVDCYISRIEIIDPQLKSVLQLNKNAPAIARALDKERKNGKSRGPLHGVPMLIKDNISTGDGLFNTAGSYTLKDSAPKVMAHLIRKLKRKGAIILGKANLSAWSEVPGSLDHGWSPRGGQVRNPYVLSANPSGSSSGSAVAVASNLAMAAMGSDTHGSIFAPSANSAVVGFKPTAGLVSRHGVIPFSITHDTVGPITRTVMDAALIMDVIAGPDSKDIHNLHVPLNYKPPKYSKFNDNLKLKGIKIGFERKIYNGLQQDEKEAVDKLVSYIKGTEAKLVYINEPLEPESKDKKFDDKIHFLIDDVEFKEGIKEYLETVKEPTVRNLSQINSLNENKIHEHNPKTLKKIEKINLNLKSPAYLKAVQTNLDWYAKNGVDRILKKYNVDVLLTQFGRPCHKIGYPILTMPFPLDKDGLPIKKPAFCTTKMNESKLFTVGFAIEAWNKRPEPGFVKCCSRRDYEKLK